MIVDRDDPAFADPTKFIGPVYSEREALQLAYTRQWSVGQDGEHWMNGLGRSGRFAARSAPGPEKAS